ncbi:MAG TPA: S8 family serine peptidase [Frankiaceae bacterium]|nr:S8 family serine peptidase [Frankiaceae bacterium]
MGPAAGSNRRLRWLAAALVTAGVTAPGLTATAATPLAKGSTWAARPGTGTGQKVIVQARAGSEAAVAEAIRALGGSVDARLGLVNGFAARVPASAVASLRAHPGVRAVTENSAVTFASNVYEDYSIASSYARASGAGSAWSAGNLGEGVGIAVIDTGISPMKDFQGRLVYGPDLSGEGSLADSYGHGTVMAGIVGGSGADSATNPNGAYAGVAPKSTLVSVKVAGRNGAADVSTMLQAMHWVSAYKDNFNIRVLNLSWGTSSTADPAVDPINYAVQRLWRQGIVVVASAGNSGPGTSTISKPGDDPVILTVGAYDDKGDVNTSNDQVPQWTSRGPTAQGLVKPDLVAPGRTLIATRSYGSTVEQQNPKALVPPSYIKGSGTSEAAAVTSGLAALVVKAHPDWTPDQVKAALKGTANPMPGVPATTQGKGRVNVGAAIAADPGPAQQQTFQSTGLGSIEGSRGSTHVYADCAQDGTYRMIQGEIDVFCNRWDAAAWTGTQWNSSAWTGTQWNGTQWNGTQWNGTQWNAAAWTDAQWTGTQWNGTQWNGTQWNGTQWNGTQWNGTQWNGTQWNGTQWNGTQWNGEGWTSAEYGDVEIGTLFLNAWWGARPKAGHYVAGEKSEPGQLARALGHD